ncbi:MAG: YcxB family protein [Xanthomonadales bacterium]|nr:YcxB family protein [Xanthomonadales bacterium]
MDCSYKLSELENVQAMQLHGRGARNTLIILIFIGIILILAAIFTEYKIIATGSVVGGVSGYFLVLFCLIPFNAKKQYKQNRALRNEITMEITEQGVNFKSESGESKLKWSDIHKWKSSGEIYLLYITSNMFHMVPSRALPNEEMLEMLLNNNIGGKKA